MFDKNQDSVLYGNTLAPGLGRGRTVVHRDMLKRFDEFYEIDDSQVDEELKRFERAIETVSTDLYSLSDSVEREVSADLSDVFTAHIAMVRDASLNDEVTREIRDELVSAGMAVKTVFRRWERRFHSMEAQIARQKGDDLRDLARRLLAALAGVRAHALENLPEGCVLVASRLLPSDTIFLSRCKASAAILEVGGSGSHAALFAHEIGLPCVAGVPGIVETIPPGAPVLVDADAAEVIINPTRAQEENFQAKLARRKQAGLQARARAHEPAITRNGKPIAVLANVGNADDTREAMENGAEGVGLYRIEQAYLGRRKPPDTEALVEEMRKTLEPAERLPVYIRLLDVGADKPLPFMESNRETNPALGCRGIRFLEQHPDLLQTQVDALLRISVDFDLHILVPMVTLEHDILRVATLLRESASRAGISSVPRLGAMIETPAAALAAPAICQHAEFLSFGTNDLTQYVFAADRENAAVDSYFDDTHDIVFRLLKTVREDVPQTSLSICGELAGRPGYISRILACGITSLSVAPPSIPAAKEAIRRSDAA